MDIGLMDQMPPPAHLVEALTVAGAQVHGLACDVGDPAQVAAAVATLRAAAGLVTVLVKNAGITANIAW